MAGHGLDLGGHSYILQRFNDTVTVTFWLHAEDTAEWMKVLCLVGDL